MSVDRRIYVRARMFYILGNLNRRRTPMLTRRQLISRALLGSVIFVAGCSQPTASNEGSGNPTPATVSAGPTPAGTGGAAMPTRGGTVTFALENDVIDFDPLRSRAFVDRNVHYQIYDSLVAINPG